MNKHFIIAMFFSMVACGEKKQPDRSLGHYDLDKPEKFSMPAILHEISGIAFNRNNEDTIYAEQDEEGRLFHFKPGDREIISSKFGSKGDYEDVTIFRETVIMLRSDGLLVTFPLSGANDKKFSDVHEWNNLLPVGEYEGLFADAGSARLYVLCKHCAEDKTDRVAGGYTFTFSGNGSLMAAGKFTLDVKEIEELAREKKIKFHPSGLARNNKTGEWYILSSVNSMIVIADENWKVKQVARLDPSVFNQPEGIAFDRHGNLYISNEGSPGKAGNILKFIYRK